MAELFFKIYGAERFEIWVMFTALTYISVILCMGIDLISGVKKAKENGIARTSTGFKKTTEKAGKYFLPMICLTFIDLITMVVFPFPALTMAMGLWNDFCEYKSVMEKAYEKKQILDAINTFDVVLKNKDDLQKAIATAVIEGLKKSAEDKEV